MSLPIFYTPRSKETLELVYHFINNKFGQKSADAFLLKAEKTIRLIALQPLMFKASQIDENVRKGLQVDSSLIQFTNHQAWQKKLDDIAAELCNAYNEKKVELVFYKMLLYEEGGHFAPHKDTLRGKNHIASLLISLPVEGGCEGGVLRVKDVSSNVTMEWDGVCEI